MYTTWHRGGTSTIDSISQAKPSPGHASLGSGILPQSFPQEIQLLYQKERLCSVHPFQSPQRWPADGSGQSRTCYTWLLLPLFLHSLGTSVEGMLRGLVNNQRKMAQAFVSPFILLITLSLTSYILLTYHFLCSCPLQCYSQFWLKQYLLNKRIILSASARGREAAFKNWKYCLISTFKAFNFTWSTLLIFSNKITRWGHIKMVSVELF